MSGEQTADLLEIEMVLAQLDREREGRSPIEGLNVRSPARMCQLIDWLRSVGEYREPIGSPHQSIWHAVEYYGAWWHRWYGVLECPHCKADLRDHEHGPPFLRTVGLVDRYRDRVTEWQCPDCEKSWPRR